MTNSITPMFQKTQTSAFEASLAALQNGQERLLQREFFFHDIRVTCHSNRPEILSLLGEMLDSFPRPEVIRGDISYSVLCGEDTAGFPFALPTARRRVETLRLLSGTKLKYYVNLDSTLEYHSYDPQPAVNGSTLTVVSSARPLAITQLEPLERYQPHFLRRYVFLIALGQMMSHFGFVPLHAAAVTAPQHDEVGALILGASGSGKTTLSIGCACEGFGFLADDLVLLRQGERSLYVHSITQEVSLRSNSLGLWDALAFLRAYPADARDKRYCSIEDIRAGAARRQAPVRLVIFPSLSDDSTSQVIPLSKAAVLQELIELGISTVHHPQYSMKSMFALLSQLAEQAAGYRLILARGASDGPQLARSLLAGAADG